MLKKFINRKLDIINRTNPDKISVDNISHFFHIPKFIAKFLCDLAVKEGSFIKDEKTYFYKLNRKK